MLKTAFFRIYKGAFGLELGTMIYTHLINFEGDDFARKTAKTLEEVKGLMEAGFEYVTDIQDIKLFHKRK